MTAVCEACDGNGSVLVIQRRNDGSYGGPMTETHCPQCNPHGVNSLRAALLHAAARLDRLKGKEAQNVVAPGEFWGELKGIVEDLRTAADREVRS